MAKYFRETLQLEDPDTIKEFQEWEPDQFIIGEKVQYTNDN